MDTSFYVLVFSVSEFERIKLDKLDEQGLYSLALKEFKKREADDSSVMLYSSLYEFQEDCNDECVDLNNNWIYFIDSTKLEKR